LISYAEAESLTKFVFLNFMEMPPITDVTGIEAFINLDTFDISCHEVEYYDFSKNTSWYYPKKPDNKLS